MTPLYVVKNSANECYPNCICLLVSIKNGCMGVIFDQIYCIVCQSKPNIKCVFL